MEDIIVRKSDMTDMKYCSSGVRYFFKKHGLDYSDFLRNGIKASVLLEVSNNDHMIVKLLENMRG